MAHPSGLYFTMREEPETQSNAGRFARLSAIQGGMRQALRNPFNRASSLYSRNTNANTTRLVPGSTPPIDFGGFFGGQTDQRTGYDNESLLNLPLNSQPLGESYSPVVQPSEWGRSAPLAQPEPAVLSTVASHETLGGTTTTTTTTTNASRSEDRERRSRRKHRRRHRHHHQDAWVRPHRSGTTSSRSGSASNVLHRGQPRAPNIYITSTVAALFLLATAVTYTAIAVSVKGLAQELHILFIITLVGAFVFLLHSLFRLRAARRRLRARQARARANPNNFSPSVPIRVHMAHDEEIGVQAGDGSAATEKPMAAKLPPPAYGLWRSSVKVNPHLLFWQRVETPAGAKLAAKAKPRNSAHRAAKQDPRPPSYLSEDGVSYIVAATPRSTVQLQRPPTELHPAFRRV